MPVPDDAPLTDLHGIGPKRAKHLAAAGYRTVGDIRAASPDDLIHISNIGEKYAWDLREAAGLEEVVELSVESKIDRLDERNQWYYERDPGRDTYWEE